MRMLLLVLVLFSFLFMGCAASQEELREAFNPYIGESVAHLIGVWGAPDRTTEVQGGYTVYTFISKSDPVSYGSAYGGYGYVNAYSTVSQSVCRVDFFVDASGIVRNFRARGDCKIVHND